MEIKTLKNLLKTWTDKELYKTSINYGLAIRQYKKSEKDNQYLRLKEMIDLIQCELQSRK
tara:strand:+ start:623 stop:802 length:180 start_codon:yes stop_codon:yes gene_type:complete